MPGARLPGKYATALSDAGLRPDCGAADRNFKGICAPRPPASPAGGALGHGAERVKILRAAAVEGSGPAGTVINEAPSIACGAGAIRILEAQRAGRAVMSGAEFQRGAQLAPGAAFS